MISMAARNFLVGLGKEIDGLDQMDESLEDMVSAEDQ
jgi:hypothetical protein